MKRDRALFRAKIKADFKKLCKSDSRYKTMSFASYFGLVVKQEKMNKKLNEIKNSVMTSKETEELSEFFTSQDVPATTEVVEVKDEAIQTE